MRKFRKRFMIIFLSILAAIVVYIGVSCVLLSPTFVFRILTRFDSSVDDYSFFPARTIAKSDGPFEYEYALNAELENFVMSYITNKNREAVMTLADFVVSTDCASFIIIKDGVIIYEQYANGYDETSINTSFSMAKSIVSLLIGKAIEDGYIDSEHQEISDFIHEFAGTDMGQITIKDLLTMRSDIYYEESNLHWFGDNALTYWMPDLRTLALNHRKLTDKYQGRFHYNNYHPLLLGIILERSADMSVSEYFEQSFWQPIGAEHDASWSLDSEETQFEKMESGLNFRSIDFIKIGSMLLSDGYWNDHQIINPDWIRKSTLVDFPIDESEYTGSFLDSRNIGYGYMWYSRPSVSGGMDFWAWGKYDQMLYISPANNTVILRTGRSGGDMMNLSEVLGYIAANIG